mgnify:CR=1 FL=1
MMEQLAAQLTDKRGREAAALISILDGITKYCTMRIPPITDPVNISVLFHPLRVADWRHLSNICFEHSLIDAQSKILTIYCNKTNNSNNNTSIFSTIAPAISPVIPPNL